MNRLAQIGVLSSGTLNFYTGIDEILISKLLGFDFFDRFWQLLQTRWNFTLCRAISVGTKSVSIPNGIEFYGKAVNPGYVNFAFQFPLGIETMNDSRREKQATR